MDNTNTTTIQQINEPKYVLELKHMKSGSSLILAINKLRVSVDDLDDVIKELHTALNEYITMER